MVSWPWLAARLPPSHSLTALPQQDKGRTGNDKGRDKDRDHLPIAITGKTDLIWEKIF